MRHQPNPHGMTFLERSVPLLTLLCPFLASVVLLMASQSHAIGSVRLYIESNRTVVSIIVQILSNSMSILQMATLTSILSASYRLHLSHHSMRLDKIGLFNALITPRISWSLPMIGVLATMIAVVVSNGPGALWAGAMTPITEVSPSTIGSIMVPRFTNSSTSNWDNEFAMRTDDVWNLVDNCIAKRVGDSSSISNCPVPNFRAQLLASAGDASTGGEAGPRNHSKLDTPSWLYQGRSYGVGSAPGLLPLVDIPSNYKVLEYVYNETGYLASVDCIRNSSSALHFEFSKSVDNVDIWEIKGTLPNSISSELSPVMAWHRKVLKHAGVAAWVGVSNNDVHMFGILTSDKYGNFSNIQCTAHFEPTLFSVQVNTTWFTIKVSASEPNLEIFDIDQSGTGHLRSNVIRSVNLLSRMSTSLYVSVLGEALQSNLETLMKLSNNDLTLEEHIMQSTSDSFVAMIDDILGVYGTAQLTLSNDMTQTHIQGSLESIKFGEALYQWAVLGINIALFLLLIVEGVRTRWWYGLPRFDPLDFKSVVAATSLGGIDVAKELQELSIPGSESGGKWTGDPNNRTLGAIPVQLSREGLAVVLDTNEAKYSLALLSSIEDGHA
jgi:hypothetical protein